ncbi:MAG TPA: class I SAM-dependent methyltransferase, partial [Anaerolineales bacterium]|nr:class I SAM-dependent methyltransferase [Anaerolineales bacterium]
MNRWLRAFLRLFFRLLYHEFAWSYDLVARVVSLGRWNSWVLSVLPYMEGPRVLELGQGPGHLQIALAEKGISVYGLDASPQMVRLAAWRMHHADRRQSQKAGNPEYLSLQPRLLIGAAPNLPYPSGYFDQIVTTFPTEYIFQQPTLIEIKRILRPGGSLLIIPAAWITGRSWLERLAAGLFHVTGQAPA